MRFRIHRGSKEIGGNCVEVEAAGKRLVLDIGLPLDAACDVALPQVPGLKGGDSSLVGVFVSHPHLDHWGLLPETKLDCPVLIGPAAKRILEVASIFVPGDIRFDSVLTLTNRQKINLGPFTLTTYLVDHSAYDAYALLVEAEGRRLFYSGDFRGHGRKGELFERFLADPPKNVDVLLMEGTTLGREEPDKGFPTESELEEEFARLFKKTRGMCLVWCSGQNIDRLVTVFRAAKRSGRLFIADMYTAAVLAAPGNANLPQAGWEGFRVFLPWTEKRTIVDKKMFDFARSFSEARIYPEDLCGIAPKAVMIFRPSMRRDLEKAGCLEGAELIYSMWSGYLTQERLKPFLLWLDVKGIPLHRLHTSGHAPLKDLKRFANAISPKALVPIHTLEPESYARHFKAVCQVGDGEWLEVV